MKKRAIRAGAAMGGVIGLTAGIFVAYQLLAALPKIDAKELVFLAFEIVIAACAGAAVGTVVGVLVDMVRRHTAPGGRGATDA